MKQIQELKGSYHYISDIQTIYGKENSIFFSASPLERSNMIRVTFSITNPEAYVSVIQGMRSDYDAIPMGGVYEDDGLLYLELNTVNISDSSKLREIIEKITYEISKRDRNRDQVTHETENLGLFRVGTKIRIVTDTSYKEEKETVASRKPKPAAFAWIMAIVGMLGGVAVWFMLSQIRIISGIAGFFIIKWGVQLFVNNGGNLHRKNGITLLVISFFMVIFAVMLPTIIMVARLPIGLTIGEILTVSFNALMTRDGLINLGIGLGFSIWSSWGLIQGLLHNTSTSVEKRVTRKNNRLM